MRPELINLKGPLLEKEYKITDTKLSMKVVVLNKKLQHHCCKHGNSEIFYYTCPHQIQKHMYVFLKTIHSTPSIVLLQEKWEPNSLLIVLYF